MPHVSSEVGTPTGPYVGYGTGSARRAMRLGLHYGMEKLQQPGFFTITAEPGSGKSVLTGALAFSAVRRGEPTIILDPSGPLAKLAAMPELTGSARVLDLTASNPGTLSPYQLVPEPHPADHVTSDGSLNELEFQRAVRQKEAAGLRFASLPDISVAARGRAELFLQLSTPGSDDPRADPLLSTVRWVGPPRPLTDPACEAPAGGPS